MRMGSTDPVRDSHRWGEHRAALETCGPPGLRSVGSRSPRPGPREGAGLEHHILEILDAFAVSYATFDESGRQLYVSPAAEALLGGDPHAEGVFRQVRDVVQRVLTDPARPSLEAGPGERGRAMRVPVGSRGGLSLHVRLLGHRSGYTVVAVIFQPRPYAHWAARASGPSEHLTEREEEVAQLLAAGKSTKEVAAALAISPHTARHHTERVYAKLGLRSRVALTLALTAPNAHPAAGVAPGLIDAAPVSPP